MVVRFQWDFNQYTGQSKPYRQSNLNVIILLFEMSYPFRDNILEVMCETITTKNHNLVRR